jgi:CHAT domain-containing protein/Tfp pilus assembly protein PilF
MIARMGWMFALLLGVAGVAQTAAPPVRLTAEQVGLMRQRDRLLLRMQQAHKAGKHDEAVELCSRAVRLQRRLSGDVDVGVAAGLQALARLEEARGGWLAAIRAESEAATVLARLFGEDHWKSVDSRLAVEDVRLLARLSEEQRATWARGVRLHQEAKALYGQGKAKEALTPMLESLHLCKGLQGEKHPEYATRLAHLALLYQAMGEYPKALPLLQQALRLCKEVLGEKHPEYANSLNNLAWLYQAMGEHKKALPLVQQVLRIGKEALGENHPDYASSLTNLAMLHQEMGEHPKALPLFQQAMHLFKEVFGEKHRIYARSLSNLASLYRAMGEHHQALPLLQQALRLHKEVQGEKHPQYASSLNDLALLYQAMGEYPKALPLLQQALRLCKEVLGEKHRDYATSLSNLGVLYQAMGEFEKALPLLQQALRIDNEALGEKHPDYAGSLNQLAALYQAMGNHKEALPLFQQALRIRKEAFGEKHPEYGRSLNDLASIYHEHRATAALALSGQALAVRLSWLRDTLDAVGERQRLLLLHEAAADLSFFASSAVDSELPASELYRWVLGLKGVQAARTRRDALLRDQEHLKPLLLELQLARAALARLANTSPPPGKVDAWRAQFDSAEKRKRDAQERLAQASPPFAQSLRTPSARSVSDTLPADSALIEFLVYTHVKADSPHAGWFRERHLLAFVLRRDRPVTLVRLARADRHFAAVTAWRKDVAAGRQPDQDVAALLRLRLWLPLEKHLEGVHTVLIAADGALAALPFAALPGKKPGSFLVEQYAFASVGSGRQLLDPTTTKPSKGLLVLGGAAYGSRPRRTGAAGPAWSELPGTAVEAAQVERLFHARFAEERVQRLTGTNADRDTLLGALKQKRHLHLATHGYFEPVRASGALPAAGIVAGAAAPGLAGALQTLVALLAVDDPDMIDRAHGFDPSGRAARITGRNPMLTAGLVLAGANRGEGESILTAEEISGLDLRGCELAVLSACETALGKQEGYQGVMGLQRAFHDAGVQNLVASLWSVSDPATSVLMEHFYEQLWDKKQSPPQALRQAQLFVLHHPAVVQQRANELRTLLVKRGIAEDVLAARGIGKKALLLPAGSGKEKRSPVAWWAPWILSGMPAR